MFERYTEKARRTIFFAHYEASQFGSPYIESEHLLIGLLREDKVLTNCFLGSHASVESIRKQIEGHTMIREAISTAVDLPLSNECKRVLKYAADEADGLEHKHIGTGHLLLGLLREKDCFAARLLSERGVTLELAREELSRELTDVSSSLRPIAKLRHPLEIHGFAMDAEYIHERVKTCRKFNWYWHKRAVENTRSGSSEEWKDIVRRESCSRYKELRSLPRRLEEGSLLYLPLGAF